MEKKILELYSCMERIALKIQFVSRILLICGKKEKTIISRIYLSF